MGVYHITYTQDLEEICLYLDGGCNFYCHGCITKYHPMDYHLKESLKESRGLVLRTDEIIFFLKTFPLSFKKVIFLGREPTQDRDFLPLARRLKISFFHI